MKHKSFFKKAVLLLCFFGTTFLFAQQENNTSFATQINSVFAGVDKTRIPHKLLIDYAMEFTELSAYNGVLTNENVLLKGHYTDIYNTLLMARVNTNVPSLVSPTVFESTWENLRVADKIVLSGLYYKYNEIKPNAAPNLITSTNNKLYDKFVNGVWQNPYDEKQVFAVASPIVKYNNLTVNVELPTALWYTNQASNVSSIAIDFGNGLGYQTLGFGQVKTVTYAQKGNYVWKYKLTLTNNQVLYSHSKIEIDGEPNQTSLLRTVNQPCSQNGFGIDEVDFVGTRNYFGLVNKAKLEIDYAFNDCVIRKPLIVVEGFDSGLLGVENPLGENDYSSFRREAFLNGGNLPFELASYDIIYINFANSRDFLQRNAFLVEDVIKWVNTQKALSGSTTPNVVLGQSMGGVLARFALRDMENIGVPHQTSLYISHDAPHQGANIPTSVLYFARHMSNQFVKTPVGDFNINPNSGGAVSISDLQKLIDAVGTQQLLSNNVSGNYSLNNNIHIAWQIELQNMGYPQQTRNIALSNANHCGNPQEFLPAAPLFIINGEGKTSFLTDVLSAFLKPITGIAYFSLAIALNEPALLLGIIPGKSKFSMDFQGYALPVQGFSTLNYKGRLAFTKKVVGLFNVTLNLTNKSFNSTLGMPSYDYYPGGRYQIPFSFGNVSYSSIWANFGVNSYVASSFNFIPATSALDIYNGGSPLSNDDYLAKYNAASPPISPKATPFVNFSTSYPQGNTNLNEQHISFNTRNGNWLATELDSNTNNNQIFDCTSFCSNANISGPEFVCTSGSYTITNQASSSNWTITEGSNLVTLTTPNTTTATINLINLNSNGYVTLTANYSNNSCGNAQISKRILVGKPIVTDPTVYGINLAYTNLPSFYTVNPVAGATSYNWTLTTISSLCTTEPVTIGNGTTTGSFYWRNCPGIYVINCYAVNSCGSTLVGSIAVNVVYAPNNGGGGGGGGGGCTGTLEVSPNPVSSNRSIALRVLPDPCETQTAPNSLRTSNVNEAKIYDMQGTLRYSNTFTGESFEMNNVNLTRGNYILNVFTSNGKTLRKVLVIQ